MTRVLFLCVGNACRSQMAEGFARAYGSDVMESESAGLYPAVAVPDVTREVMAEKNIDLTGHFPKGLSEVDLSSFDIVVNMSGYMLPVETPGRLIHWDVRDPIGEDKETHQEVARQIEREVMQLILELRARRRPPQRPKKPRLS